MAIIMSDYRYYILFCDGRNVVAGVAPPFSGNNWPSELWIRGTKYLPLKEDTFIFWNELHDITGATVGYTFFLPESPTFRVSNFLHATHNVSCDGVEVRVLLQPCDHPEEESTQGFDSEIYAREDDQRDCVLYMLDWSQNRVAFPLHSLV